MIREIIEEYISEGKNTFFEKVGVYLAWNGLEPTKEKMPSKDTYSFVNSEKYGGVPEAEKALAGLKKKNLLSYTVKGNVLIVKFSKKFIDYIVNDYKA